VLAQPEEVVMRAVLCLAFAATVATAQSPNDTASYTIRVRAADEAQSATMSISWSARIFTSIGGIAGTNSGVKVGPSGGSGHGTVVADLAKGPGRLTFTAPVNAPELELSLTRRDGARVPRLVARGRVVVVAVNVEGEYSVSSQP
jgi:hypothetical protein